MVMHPSERLDATFAALADPTRRAILARLAAGEASVTELAKPFAMSQPAISKHPEVFKRWFGPRGWSLVQCDVDLKVGGGFRFVMRGPDGRDMGMRGRYLEIAPPDRSVHMESFDDFPGESQVTAVFVEEGGKTTMT